MQLNEMIIDFINKNCSGFYKENRLQLEDLCKKLNLRWLSADFPPNIAGGMSKDDDGDGYTIYVNKDHPKIRKRFTIARFIGHYISYVNGSFSKDWNNPNAEIEASLIAAELLMPEQRVRTLIKDNLTIEEMADIFFVSKEEMAIRLQKLFPELMDF